jgi:branched-chain amino acid transport system ATP-binding protein
VSVLDVSELTVARGAGAVVRGCSLCVPRGEVTVLLGPNGAGKTTLLEALSGVLRAAGGRIELDGRPIGGLRRERRARLGLAHVEQGRTVFAGLTVEQNLSVTASDRTALAATLETFPELRPRRRVPAGQLSGGEQQMLVLARALASQPTILLIDEMSLGLAPAVIERLMPLVRTLADEGMGVLLVERYASLALEIADRAYVLSRGAVAYEGDCAALLASPELLHGSYFSRPGA